MLVQNVDPEFPNFGQNSLFCSNNTISLNLSEVVMYAKFHSIILYGIRVYLITNIYQYNKVYNEQFGFMYPLKV